MELNPALVVGWKVNKDDFMHYMQTGTYPSGETPPKKKMKSRDWKYSEIEDIPLPCNAQWIQSWETEDDPDDLFVGFYYTISQSVQELMDIQSRLKDVRDELNKLVGEEMFSEEVQVYPVLTF